MGVLAAVAVRRAQVAGQDETKRDKTRPKRTKRGAGCSAVRCRLLSFEWLCRRRHYGYESEPLLLGLKSTTEKYNRVKSITKHYKTVTKKVKKSKKHYKRVTRPREHGIDERTTQRRRAKLALQSSKRKRLAHSSDERTNCAFCAF